MTTEWVTVREAASVFGVTRQSIHGCIARGKLIADRSCRPMGISVASMRARIWYHAGCATAYNAKQWLRNLEGQNVRLNALIAQKIKCAEKAFKSPL